MQIIWCLLSTSFDFLIPFGKVCLELSNYFFLHVPTPLLTWLFHRYNFPEDTKLHHQCRRSDFHKVVSCPDHPKRHLQTDPHHQTATLQSCMSGPGRVAPITKALAFKILIININTHIHTLSCSSMEGKQSGGENFQTAKDTVLLCYFV